MTVTLSYPWLEEPYQQLQQIYQQGMPVHPAWLLQIPPGYAAQTLLPHLATWLLCKQPEGQQACGKCHSCQLMQANHHPDWHHLQVEEGKQQISIDAVRQLLMVLQQHARQNGRKIVVISEVERLTEAASNALLKTLEEPTEHCYFFLTTYQSEKVLATIRSRCLHWRFPLLTQEQVINYLQRQDSTLPYAHCLAAYHLSQQAPLLAQQLLTAGLWQQRAQLFTQLQQGLKKRRLQPVLALCHQDNAPQLLHWLLVLLVDSSKWQQQLNNYVVNQDQLSLIAQLASQMTARSIMIVQQQLMESLQVLENHQGINQQLILANFLITWQQHLSAI